MSAMVILRTLVHGLRAPRRPQQSEAMRGDRYCNENWTILATRSATSTSVLVQTLQSWTILDVPSATFCRLSTDHRSMKSSIGHSLDRSERQHVAAQDMFRVHVLFRLGCLGSHYRRYAMLSYHLRQSHNLWSTNTAQQPPNAWRH